MCTTESYRKVSPIKGVYIYIYIYAKLQKQIIDKNLTNEIGETTICTAIEKQRKQWLIAIEEQKYLCE